MAKSLATERPPSGPSPWDRFARQIIGRRLAGISRGELLIEDVWGQSQFGQSDDLRAVVRVHEPRFFRQALLGGTLSVAESYLRGDWDCDDLPAFFRIFVRNLQAANQVDGGLATIQQLGHRVYHWWHRNSPTGSRNNIRAHYDLGNDFFRLWLDDTWAYSSGIFASPDSTLREASTEKFDRVCRKLELSPTDQLLEIGGGWGGFAMHAAARYRCQVTTTTISQEQFELARERIAAAGLSDRISLLQQDYRDLNGKFDRVASIEMIEAIGHQYLDSFFRKCSELLHPDGSLVLQAIVMPERGHDRYLNSVDFIQRYVFPGGCLPSLASMLSSAGRSTDLRFVHAEDFAPHYAETLRRWRRKFLSRLPEVRRLGYSDEFVRLWDYYLSYCEAAFEERYIGVLQVQFDKPECRRDPLELSRRAAERHVRRVPSCSAPSNSPQARFSKGSFA